MEIPMEQPPKPMIQVDAPNFDLEAYIANYTGRAKLDRLEHIAQHCSRLAIEAYRMMIDELKTTQNTVKYRKLMETGIDFGAGYEMDQEWLGHTETRATRQLERLEMELNGYKTNLIKESVRMGQNDLGDYYLDRGELHSALKCYVRTRDYCTTSKHVIQMCLNVVEVSIGQRNYTNVINYVSKAEQIPDVTDPVIQGKLRVASGLGALDSEKYKVAARKFTEVPPVLGSTFSNVLAPHDIALYGGLCALAMFDRHELRDRVLDSTTFRQHLEQFPAVREMINDFYNSNYASCLACLDSLRDDILLDLHLHEHVDTLTSFIRQRALVQYFSPFQSVDMHKMSAAFNTDVESLQSELANLIIEERIRGRIDARDKILHCRSEDERMATYTKVMKLSDAYERRTRSMLLKVNMLRHDLVTRKR